jgi:DNA excision repair protein ERCC-2
VRYAPVRLKIAVRTLAQLTCRRGDIHFRYDDSTDAQEGIDIQKRLQRDRPATYQREAPVKRIWRDGDVELELTGRADGYDRSLGLVEEFKATRVEHVRLFEHAGSVHLGQLRLYAAALAHDDVERTQWNLRLLYCDPETDAITPFEERMSRDALEDFLDQCCRRLATGLLELRAHRAVRDAHLAKLKFPFAEFRPAQRALSADVYRTVRDGGALLFEAPTGSGKTLSALFPSLIAMGHGNTDRVVFLSSRTTGQTTAESSVDLLDTGGVVRRVTVTAKAKVCFMPEPVCDPAICPYARGYYDRSEAAVSELLAVGRMTRSVIETVARAHQVCPFELSLDAAVWADVVICDYNYVFDPVVRLKRLAGIADDRIALLIDEAHQLGDRVRESLSTIFDRGHIARAKADLSPSSAKRAAALDRRLTTLRRDVVRQHNLDRNAFECRIDLPDSLLRSAEALLETLTDRDDERSQDPAVTELLFALLRMLRVAGWYDAGRFAVFLRGRGRDIALDLRCLDPSSAIADTLKEYRAHVRFSATLSPFELTGRAHGQPDVRALRLPSPFPPDRLGVFVVPDISTLYRNRSQSLPRLLEAIHCVVDSHAGNYLIALPSFEYLDLVAGAYASRHSDQRVLRQSRGMSDELRAGFIDTFVRTGGAPVVGFVVLGGVFTESIDLPNDALHGIVVVGIGLPPPTLERNEMARTFGSFGRMLAYEQPAMTRVVQAAGRLIRRAADRGVVCLIDDRFLSTEFRQYLPRHWQPVRTPARQLCAALRAFWNPGTV